ncbi:MAG: carboxypeptidase-like regulatory domain-containing protein, partial [Salibacteraceae bacterium]|nr:carboxypeptidase-like regulatory domain-containing protein [Salibacteraceae bacterium]
MKQLLLSLCMTVMLFAAQGQIITVVDAENGQTIPLVTLFSESQNISVITDAHGQADISAYTQATDIEFRSIGYKSRTMAFSELEAQKFTVELQQNSISLNQVVVSASKWSQTSREVPSKIKVISAKDIALQNPQTAADLLASSGEVYIQKSQQGGGSPM